MTGREHGQSAAGLNLCHETHALSESQQSSLSSEEIWLIISHIIPMQPSPVLSNYLHFPYFLDSYSLCCPPTLSASPPSICRSPKV